MEKGEAALERVGAVALATAQARDGNGKYVQLWRVELLEVPRPPDADRGPFRVGSGRLLDAEVKVVARVGDVHRDEREAFRVAEATARARQVPLVDLCGAEGGFDAWLPDDTPLAQRLAELPAGLRAAEAPPVASLDEWRDGDSLRFSTRRGARHLLVLALIVACGTLVFGLVNLRSVSEMGMDFPIFVLGLIASAFLAWWWRMSLGPSSLEVTREALILHFGAEQRRFPLARIRAIRIASVFHVHAPSVAGAYLDFIGEDGFAARIRMTMAEAQRARHGIEALLVQAPSRTMSRK